MKAACRYKVSVQTSPESYSFELFICKSTAVNLAIIDSPKRQVVHVLRDALASHFVMGGDHFRDTVEFGCLAIHNSGLQL